MCRRGDGPGDRRVISEVTARQQRLLEPMYAVVFFDARRVNIRDEATVRSQVVSLALAIRPDGPRDLLGIWIEQTDRAKVWMKVFTDLKVRGGQNMLIAVTDGLNGMREVREAPIPRRPRKRASSTCFDIASIPLFAFPPDVRRAIDTTNALERVNAGVRKIIKERATCLDRFLCGSAPLWPVFSVAPCLCG